MSRKIAESVRKIAYCAHEHLCVGRSQAFPGVQSTVQRRIAELEECVGHRLVERHLGSYQMTELGEQLLPAAEGVESAVAAFERHLAASDKALTGIVRLTCGSGLANVLQRTPLIDAFHARFPGLRVDPGGSVDTRYGRAAGW